MAVSFRKAYYIKLGRGGLWEVDAISSGVLRLGWNNQSVDDINARLWHKIDAELKAEQPKKPGVATTDLNRLRDIAESTQDDIWITFHGAKLWWARLALAPVEVDEISKFRRTVSGWSDRAESGQLLVVNDLPGKIAMLQGFRGTACQVKEHQLLERLLSGERSLLAQQIDASAEKLISHLLVAISELHWKDYETLVDLVFRDTGWQRVSVLGQQAKGYDLELRESMTNARYVVQIKSQATLADLIETANQFSAADYRRVFFVVHTPAPDLSNSKQVPEHVELVAPEKLARLALEAGLIGWLKSKVI